jgi:hypothetical protein
MFRDKEIEELCEKILARECRIEDKVEQIWAHLFGHEPTALGPLTQIGGSNMPTNNTIVVGNSGVFAGGALIPTGSAFAPGVLPTYACSDASLVLTPAADGSSVSVAIPAGYTGTSISLQESYVRVADGVVVQSPALTITILPATTPPLSNEPTGLGPLTQIS